VSLIDWQRIALGMIALVIYAVKVRTGISTPLRGAFHLIVVAVLLFNYSLMYPRYDSELLFLTTFWLVALEVIWARNRHRGPFWEQSRGRGRWLRMFGRGAVERYEKNMDEASDRFS
jgi:hypothetical protein